MDPKHKQTSPENTPRHEGGDPASLAQDPAQFYPTGGAGLLDPRNDPARDDVVPPEPNKDRPAKEGPGSPAREIAS